jgi:Cu(I)/Ag(I) efflux system membrane fusion protein
VEDLLRARRRQPPDREAERLARKRLRIWNIDDDQIEEFIRTGKTELTITAPATGHVVTKYQRVGTFVDEGTPLYDMNDLKTVWVEAQVYEADQSLLHEGQWATATTLALPNREFGGTLDFIYPHLDESSRTLTVRFQLPNTGHLLRPGMYATVKVEVMPWQMDELAWAMAQEGTQELAADTVSHAVRTPAGLPVSGIEPLLRLAIRRAELRSGRLPAVPESAVIDTGALKIVYREATPGVYEGVAVRLGPRMAERGGGTAFYPVLRGLRLGDRVVTHGAFLIDAETRLNAAAGSIYFGGSGGKAGQSAESVRPSTPVPAETRGTRKAK